MDDALPVVPKNILASFLEKQQLQASEGLEKTNNNLENSMALICSLASLQKKLGTVKSICRRICSIKFEHNFSRVFIFKQWYNHPHYQQPFPSSMQIFAGILAIAQICNFCAT